MEKQHVVIVAQGSFGNLKEDEYRSWTETYVAMLESARRQDPHTKEEVPVATVEVVPSVAVLREKFSGFPRPDVVIFRTCSMLVEARAIKREFPRAKVIVFTGAMPDDEVILVHKRWNIGIDGLRSIILD